MLGSRSVRLLSTGLGLLLALVGYAAFAAVQDDGPSATPTSGAMAAVALTVANGGETGDVLLGGATDVAERVELYRTVDGGGTPRIQPEPDGIQIPAGETVTFDPGGDHLMLVGLTADLRNGTTYDLTLDFASAGSVTVPVQVRPRAAPLESVPAPKPVTVGALTISGAWSHPASAQPGSASSAGAGEGAIGSQTAGDLTVSLTIDRDAAGPRQLSVTIVGADGAPVADATVTFRTQSLVMDHGIHEQVATAISPGVYTVEQVPMGMGGDWQTEVTVERPDAEPVVVTFVVTLRGPG